MFEKIKRWYDMGLWTRSMVEMGANLKVITQEELALILGEAEE